MTLGVMPTYIRRPQELAVATKAIITWKATCDEELVVVDDASPSDDMRVRLAEFIDGIEGIRLVLKPTNEGFAATVNVGLRQALEAGSDAVLVNSDIEFLHSEWLAHLESNDAWVVGALLLFPNRLIQHAGIYFSVITRTFDHIFKYAPGSLVAATEKRVCPVTGALQLIRHDALKKVGLYDESFRLGWEDVSYCHDIFVAGERCVYEPTCIAIHHEGLFRGKNPNDQIREWQELSWLRLHEKHKGLNFSEWCPTLVEGYWE